MSKDTTITAQDGGPSAKPSIGKPSVGKPAVSEPRAAKPKSAKTKSGAPTKGAVKKAAKAVAKVTNKAAGRAAASAKTSAESARKVAATRPVNAMAVSAKSVGAKPVTVQSVSANAVSAKPIAPAKPAAKKKAVEPAPAAPSFRLPMPAAVPAVFAMNTKLVNIAQSNVDAGLELARNLASAKTPLEAMRLGVAYWFNHMGAVQAQARELQSLSAAWVKSAGEQMRAR